MILQTSALSRCTLVSVALALTLWWLPAHSQTATPEAAPASAPVAVKAPPQDAKCMECHDDIFEEKVIHVALEKGCTTCHAQLDAAKRPHKSNSAFPHGLKAAQPEICLSCHEKEKFKKKSTHKALEKGCTVCHDPHSTSQKKLLKSAIPELCFSCHKKKNFAGKFTHSAVKGAKCASCHLPHASDNALLLKKTPTDICLDCHDDIKEAPHIMAGFSGKGHPLGDEVHAKPVEDPLRPGRPFFCGSCHDPHKGDFPKLLRQDPKLGMDVCQKCHQK